MPRVRKLPPRLTTDLWNELVDDYPRKSPCSYIVYREDDTYYADACFKGGTDYSGSDAATVIQSAINALTDGGKIFIKEGTYNLTSTLLIEGFRDPNYATIMIEGEGFNRATILKLISASTLNTFISLRGSSHIHFRNLLIDANNDAKYIIRMERDASGEAAGNHLFENVILWNADVGALLYGAENVQFLNSRIFGTKLGLLISAFPPVTDPTVVDSTSVNTGGTEYSSLGTTLLNSQIGDITKTTKASIVIYRANVRMFGGMSWGASTGEANFIIDEGRWTSVFSGVWIDNGATRGWRIGNYPSASLYHSHVDILGCDALGMDGDNIVEAEYLKTSNIVGLSTTRGTGKIVLGSTTRRNYIATFSKLDGTYLTVDDSGINNIIDMKNYWNSGTATFNGGTTVFNIPHGLASTPSSYLVTPASSDAKGEFYVTADATNIVVTYTTAPPAKTNNVKLTWRAEV